MPLRHWLPQYLPWGSLIRWMHEAREAIAPVAVAAMEAIPAAARHRLEASLPVAQPQREMLRDPAATGRQQPNKGRPRAKLQRLQPQVRIRARARVR